MTIPHYNIGIPIKMLNVIEVLARRGGMTVQEYIIEALQAYIGDGDLEVQCDD